MAIRTRPPLRRTLADTLRLRCPNCRKGPIFANWLNKVLPHCPNCGLSYYRESGYYVGAMMLTYVCTALTLLAAYLFSLLLPDSRLLTENAKLAIWIVLAILLTLSFVRPAYSLWLSVDFWIAPWEPNLRNTQTSQERRDSL